MEYNNVKIETKEDIAILSIDRPKVLNALNSETIAEIQSALAEIKKNDAIRVLIITGAGEKAFVAGADIRYFVDKIKADKIGDIAEFTRKGHELLLEIENSEKLTIALLDGLSLGGGSELALACQAVVATPAGSMGFPETAIGIFPGLGGMLRMARIAGPVLAKYYVFTGVPISAEDAQALGIVTRLVAPAEVSAAINQLVSEGKPDKYQPIELPERFKTLAQVCSSENVAMLLAGKLPAGVPEEIASKTVKRMSYRAPIALKLANEIIDQQVGKSMTEAVEIELGRLNDIFSTADALEGLSTVGRKKPEYKGV